MTNQVDKIKKIGIFFVIATCLLGNGCTGIENKPSGSKSKEVSSVLSTSQVEQDDAYYFENNGVKIALKAPTTPILENLGEPLNYFEAPSCAFDGMDKIYTYAGFEIHTYTENEVDYVFSILFTDDSVKTREGISLFANLEEVIEKYGTDYVEFSGQYTYSTDDRQLSFLLKDDEVISIEYSLKTDQ